MNGPVRVGLPQLVLLPLTASARLAELCRAVARALESEFQVTYDDHGTIHERYERHTATMSATVDFEMFRDGRVELRVLGGGHVGRLPLSELSSHAGERA